MLSALQLHSFPHLADPLGEGITSINITLILAIIIYSYKKRTSTFQNLKQKVLEFSKTIRKISLQAIDFESLKLDSRLIVFKLDQGMGTLSKWHFGESRKSIIDFLGVHIFLVEKIYFGIHFQFLSLQSKTNVLSVGNKNCKRQHASYKLEWIKILNQEIIVKAQPIRFQ